MAGRLRLPSRPRGPRDEARMTLIEHLDELRSRIIKVGVAFVTATIVAWFFRKQIYELLLEPAVGRLHGKLYVTGVAEQFVSDMKLALFAAFVVTIPVLLYQTWAFVAPAVGDMGKTFTYILITLASSLFVAGVVFGYIFVVPVGVQFLLGWAPDRYTTITTPTNYLAFVTRFLLACGIVFELPAATYVCAKLELIDAPVLKKYRRHAIVVNTIVAAAITPSPDPFSMLLLAVPLIGMYELSIVIARYVNPTTEVTAHELARDEDGDEGQMPEEDAHDEDEADDPQIDGFEDADDHPENGHERDL
jgi:sec-independent protein translocase protein TatC